MNNSNLPPLDDKKQKVRKLKLPDLSSFETQTPKEDNEENEFDIFNSEIDDSLIELEDNFNNDSFINIEADQVDEDDCLSISGIIVNNKTKNGITLILVKESNSSKYVKLPFEDNSMINEYVELTVEQIPIGYTKDEIPVYKFLDILKREDTPPLDTPSNSDLDLLDHKGNTNTKGFFKNALAAIKAELAESKNASNDEAEDEDEISKDDDKANEQKKSKPRKTLFSKIIKLIIFIIIFCFVFVVGKNLLFSDKTKILNNDSTKIEILNSEIIDSKVKVTMKNKSDIYANFYLSITVKEKSLIPFLGKTFKCEGSTLVLDLNQTVTDEISCDTDSNNLKLKNIDIIVEN